MLPETKSRSRATRLRAGQVRDGNQQVMSFPTELWNRKNREGPKIGQNTGWTIRDAHPGRVHSNVSLERGFFFQRNPGKGDFEGLQARAVLRRLWARFSEGGRLAQAKARGSRPIRTQDLRASVVHDVLQRQSSSF